MRRLFFINNNVEAFSTYGNLMFMDENIMSCESFTVYVSVRWLLLATFDPLQLYKISYSGKFLWSKMFVDLSKIRCEPYKLFDFHV